MLGRDDLSTEENVIFFPASLSESDPCATFDFCNDVLESDGLVVLDASNLQFIDPLGLAVLKSVLERTTATRFHVRWMRQHLINYLVRMEFFDGLSVDGIDVEKERNPQGEPDRCVELVKVVDGRSEEVASRLALAMVGNPNGRPQEEMDSYRRPIEYALKELLENALSHAKRRKLWSVSLGRMSALHDKRRCQACHS